MTRLNFHLLFNEIRIFLTHSTKFFALGRKPRSLVARVDSTTLWWQQSLCLQKLHHCRIVGQPGAVPADKVANRYTNIGNTGPESRAQIKSPIHTNSLPPPSRRGSSQNVTTIIERSIEWSLPLGRCSLFPLHCYWTLGLWNSVIKN